MLKPDPIRFRLQRFTSSSGQCILHHHEWDLPASPETGDICVASLLMPLQSCKTIQLKTLKGAHTLIGPGTPASLGDNTPGFPWKNTNCNFCPFLNLWQFFWPACCAVYKHVHGTPGFSSDFAGQSGMGRKLSLNSRLYLNSTPCGSPPPCLAWVELKSPHSLTPQRPLTPCSAMSTSLGARYYLVSKGNTDSANTSIFCLSTCHFLI